jgi:hypothetical protein
MSCYIEGCDHEVRYGDSCACHVSPAYFMGDRDALTQAIREAALENDNFEVDASGDIRIAPEQIAKGFALEWLNRQGGDPLPDDYFTRVTVMYRVDDDFLFEFDSADDGGPARMFANITDGQITFAAWYFDTTWGEMK